MTEQKNTSIFTKGEMLSNEYFTVNSWLYQILVKEKNKEFDMDSATFESGARTHCNTHPKRQVLVATEGESFYQEKSKASMSLKKGNLVNVTENVGHWHCASVKSKYVHIDITNYKGNENVVWMKPVSDEDYFKVNKNQKQCAK